jgi:hypothetical protein
VFLPLWIVGGAMVCGVIFWRDRGKIVVEAV